MPCNGISQAPPFAMPAVVKEGGHCPIAKEGADIFDGTNTTKHNQVGTFITRPACCQIEPAPAAGGLQLLEGGSCEVAVLRRLGPWLLLAGTGCCWVILAGTSRITFQHSKKCQQGWYMLILDRPA
jgi:hypothetical protein